MKFVTFIHNDDVKCFHVVVQGTHKLVVMGHINFEDHALIKRQRVDEKKNVMNIMCKDVKNWGNVKNDLCLLLEIVCIFKVFGVHYNMSVESAIEKLQQIAKEKEVQKNEHR
jgi:hypothetical protein